MSHRSGKHRTLLTIQTRTDTADGAGGRTLAWSTFCTLWGKQVIWRGSAEFQADQLSSMQVSRWETRYSAGVQPKMRVLLGSRTFEIGTIFDPDQKRQNMILVCEELQNPGV